MEIEKLYNIFLNSSGITTDSRKINQGNIFFALKGERFNGNQFAEKAIADGAAYAVIDEENFSNGDNFLIVDNVLATLQDLANFYRRQFSIPVIAICGSNGKTTTKELISAVLETTFKIHATPGNFNNHIGVPLTLLSMKKETEIAIIEIGANHIGETAALCEIAEPDYGLITNNGKDHLEGFGSIEGVKKANGELYDFLRGNKAMVFVSNLHQDLMQMSEGMNRVIYGKKDAECGGEIIDANPFLELKTSAFQLHTRLIGQYNFENIMAAVCIGNYFKVADDKIKTAIEKYQSQNNRSEFIEKGSNYFILDAYNANPSSMEAALESFNVIASGKKIVILGDMLELGKESYKEHMAIAELLKKFSFAKIILTGEEFKKVKDHIHCLHFDTTVELKKWLTAQNFSDTYFLLKASRRIRLEMLLA